MKVLKSIFVFVLVLFVCSASAKKKSTDKPIYMFGISASFLDSVVYITDIQRLDSIKLDAGFLPNTGAYSYQLKNYIEQSQNQSNRTCAVYYSPNRKKLNKVSSKLKSKYQKNKLTLKPVAPDAFMFKKAMPE